MGLVIGIILAVLAGFAAGAFFILYSVTHLENMWLDRLSNGLMYLNEWQRYEKAYPSEHKGVQRNLEALRGLLDPEGVFDGAWPETPKEKSENRE